MAKTNTKAQRAHQADTTHEGTPAKRLNPEQTLRRSVLAHMLWEDGFYEDGEEVATRIADCVAALPTPKLAALALEARERMKLRHVPLWLTLQTLRSRKDRTGIAAMLASVIQRPDEITEFLSLYWKDGKVPIAAQVKKGLAAAFRQFSAYSLAKYNGEGAVRLRDALFLCHAEPKNAEQAKVWKQLVDGTLPAPDTWEVALSAGKDKKATWERLISEGALGGLAMLRNLRNMQEASVSDAMIRTGLMTMKVDRILPFRFIAAARFAPRFEPELEAAMFRCLAAMPKFPGRTALVIDCSGSMHQEKVSTKSEMTRFDVAAALAMLCREVCETVSIYAFNNQAYDVAPRRGFALRDALHQCGSGGSYGGLACLQAAKHGYDRIIVLTDGQWHYSSGTNELKNPTVVAPAPLTEKAYMVNMASNRNGVGYGKWTEIDGWSEATLDYIAASEGAQAPGSVDQV